MEENAIFTGVSNYYGEIAFVFREGKYYMELNDYRGMSTREISKEFYEMAKMEFKNAK